MPSASTGLTFTRSGSDVILTGTIKGTANSSLTMHPGDYQVLKNSSGVLLKPLNEAYGIGYIHFDDVVSPAEADDDALEVALRSFFSIAVQSRTYADAIAAQDAGTLADGWIEITDRESGVLLPVVNGKIGNSGHAGFLDVNWTGADADTSEIEPLTSVAFTDFEGEWTPAVGSFAITYSTVTGGPFAAGDSLTATNGWTGTAVDSTTVYSTSTSPSLPDLGDTLDNGGGDTATLDTMGARNPAGFVVVWLDPLNQSWRNFQCIDIDLLDGFDPVNNPAAYTILPRSAGMGYVPVTNQVEFDLYNDWSTNDSQPDGIVTRRSNSVVDGVFTKAMSLTFANEFNALDLIRWGSGEESLNDSVYCSDPQGWHHERVEIPSSQILAMGSSPVTIGAGAGAATAWEIQVALKYSYASSPYALAVDLEIQDNTANPVVGNIPALITSAASCLFVANVQTAPVLLNRAYVLTTADGSDPTGGDGDLVAEIRRKLHFFP